jgi:hypothetical protein
MTEVIMKGAANVQRRLVAMQAQIERNKNRAARAAANLIKVAIKEQTPTRAGPGKHKLRSSVRVVGFSSGYVVGPTAWYARLVVKGHAAPATEIQPKRKRALEWSSGGQAIFAGASAGGAARPNPYVDRAYALARGEATVVAGEVLFHDAPDLNEGA